LAPVRAKPVGCTQSQSIDFLNRLTKRKVNDRELAVVLAVLNRVNWM